MKNLTARLSLFALVLLVVSSCKPKTDMDFVNTIMNAQTKITEAISSFKGETSTMEKVQTTFAAQADEMMKADPNSGASGLMSQFTSLLGNRGSILSKFTALTPMVTGLLAKYKSGDLKIKDAKGQFDGIQGKLTEALAENTKSASGFSDLKSKFKTMYDAYKAVKK